MQLPDHELIADVARGWERYKKATTFLEWMLLAWLLMSLLLFLNLSGVRLEHQVLQFDGDAMLFARAVVHFLHYGFAALILIIFHSGWPAPWLTIPATLALSIPVGAFAIGSMKWSIILALVLAVITVIAYALLAPLFQRRGLYTLIRRVRGLYENHRQGIHQVISIDGHGPWAVKLQAVQQIKSTPKFSNIEVHTPPTFARGDFIVLNRSKQVELSGRISRRAV